MTSALRRYLQAERGRQRRLAEQLEINESHLSNIATGKKSASTEILRRIAELTGIDPAELLGADMPPGLSEQVTPYIPPRVASETTLDAIIAPQVRSRTMVKVNTGAPGFGIHAGDLLVIDMRSAARPGDIVQGAVIDGDFVETRILRYLPPFLISDDAAEPPIPEASVRIQGPVAGLMRGAPSRLDR